MARTSTASAMQRSSRVCSCSRCPPRWPIPTTGGRLVDLVLEFYAITVVATIAGSLGAFFLRRGREREADAEPDAGGTALS